LRAVARVGGGGAGFQGAERVPGLGELGQALADLGEVLVDEVGDVPAGGWPSSRITRMLRISARLSPAAWASRMNASRAAAPAG
jgi:hypothetical protein